MAPYTRATTTVGCLFSFCLAGFLLIQAVAMRRKFCQQDSRRFSACTVRFPTKTLPSVGLVKCFTVLSMTPVKSMNIFLKHLPGHALTYMSGWRSG